MTISIAVSVLNGEIGQSYLGPDRLMKSNTYDYYLVHNGTNKAFYLGGGDWPFIFDHEFDKHILLERLVALSVVDDWVVVPQYLLWLRDKIIEFIDDKEFEVAKFKLNENNNLDVVISSRQFGAIFINHVNDNYV